MKKMKLSTKLTSSFIIIITLSILLASLGIFSIVSTNKSYIYLLDTPVEKERILREMKLQFTFMRFRGANFAMEVDNPDIITNTLTPQYEGAYSSFTALLSDYIEDIEKDTQQNPEAKQQNQNNADALSRLVGQFKQEVDKVRSIALTGDAAMATQTLRNTIPIATEVNELLDEMIASAIDWVNEESGVMGRTANIFTIALILAAVTCVIISIALIRFIMNKLYWYENILDNIPFPISVTDKNMNWTFINRAVENFLGKKRPEVLGQHCSNWGAAICNTPNCGVNCIERGQTATTFNQMGMDFKVDVAYLTDSKSNKTGHIEIVQEITEMVKKQKAEAELVQEIENISGKFVNATRQIADGAQLLAQGSTEQAATVQELSASTAEVAKKTKENAEMAGSAAHMADMIMKNAEKSNRQMDEMMNAVNEINQASQSIGKVIKVIDDIAFQTNILALNAAVEAARAGQHGKGFAVVADEVRNLAAKSADAAKDTGELIANSIEKAKLGAGIAEATATSLDEIVSGINESSQVVNKIAKSSDEQQASIKQINDGIDQVAQVVQQNSATAEESAAAAQQLSGQSDMLEQLVKHYLAKG